MVSASDTQLSAITANSQAITAMDQLLALVADDMQAVNQAILTHMQSPVALIPQLAGHLIAAGGKRLRPVLTLAAAQLVGYAGNRHIGLAACVEFIHTATLLHDDVVDESQLRRGRQSANAIWGNEASVLVGDFLFSRAFQLMTADGSLEVLRILSSASAVIAEGEVLQLMTANEPETTEAEYLQVIESKTAVLFDAACRIGAVVAERPSIECDALGQYGLYLGIAFQLIDDVLDYSANQQQLGKNIGDDFREGKITLPILHCWAKGTLEERAFLQRTLAELDQQPDDFAQALALMHKYDALGVTMARARDYARKAQAALAAFPRSPMRDILEGVADFVVDRAY